MNEDPHVVVPAERAPELNVLGTSVTVLHQGPNGDVTHQSGEEGTGPPPHRHPWDEWFYVLQGSIEFTCYGEVQLCEPGTFVHAPAGMLHGFTYGPEGGAMLEWTGPGSQSAEMFTALSTDLEPGPPDVAKVVEILARHGAAIGA